MPSVAHRAQHPAQALCSGAHQQQSSLRFLGRCGLLDRRVGPSEFKCKWTFV